MSKRPETIAIIPARGGSKGIPRKNIADLAGKPLIAYSILAARHAQYIDRVVVSTEDEEIAEVARKYGAEVPFLRPKELAQDTSCIGDAINYTLTRLEVNRTEKAIVQLYPTSPFRSSDFIDDMLEILYRGYSSVITVKEVHLDPQLLYFQKGLNGQMVNIQENNDIPKWKKYYRQYAVFMAHMKQKEEKHYYYVITDKCMLIDIDMPKDLRWAEAVIRKNFFHFDF